MNTRYRSYRRLTGKLRGQRLTVPDYDFSKSVITTNHRITRFSFWNFQFVTHSHAVQLHNWVLCLPLLDLLISRSFIATSLFIYLDVRLVYSRHLFGTLVCRAFSDYLFKLSDYFGTCVRFEHLHIFFFNNRFFLFPFLMSNARARQSFSVSRSTRYALSACNERFTFCKSKVSFLASCVMQFARQG